MYCECGFFDVDGFGMCCGFGVYDYGLVGEQFGLCYGGILFYGCGEDVEYVVEFGWFMFLFIGYVFDVGCVVMMLVGVGGLEGGVVEGVLDLLID